MKRILQGMIWCVGVAADNTAFLAQHPSSWREYPELLVQENPTAAAQEASMTNRHESLSGVLTHT